MFKNKLLTLLINKVEIFKKIDKLFKESLINQTIIIRLSEQQFIKLKLKMKYLLKLNLSKESQHRLTLVQNKYKRSKE